MTTRQKQFEELSQTIKEKKVSQIVKLNDFVDVFDNFNSWRNGYILDIKGDELKVRFDGWSFKYDETHKINSSRVALFRVHTEPYTGGTKSAIREFTFDKEIDRMNKVIERLQKMAILNFEHVDAYDIQQFLRGEVYFLLDSILQESRNLSDDELKTSCDFIESFIRFFIYWLDYITNHDIILDVTILTPTISQYIDGKHYHPLMMAFHVNTSIVSCFPELFDSMNKIFYGGTLRTKKFYQTNEFQLSKMAQTQGKYAGNSKDRINTFNSQVINFVNYFGENEGFTKLLQLLNWQYVQENEVKHRIPLTIIKNMLQTMEAVTQTLKTSFKEEYAIQFKEAVFNRIVHLTKNDLKENETSMLFSILKSMPRTFNWMKNIHMESECAEVKLALGFMKSSILEKKIKGIKELGDIIEKVSNTYKYSSSMDNVYFNENLLASFFNQEKVFDIILNECFHPEVLKRGQAVLKFIAEQVGFSQKDLSNLWSLAQNKHESDSRAIYDAISEMAKVISEGNLEYIFEQVICIPVQEYDMPLLNFIQQFTLNAAQNRNNKGGRYGLTLLWELIQDSSELSDALISGAITSFINCVKQIKSEKEKYLALCLENVKRGVSQAQSLLVGQHIIDSYGMGQMMWSRDSSEDMLQKVLRDTPLVDVVVKDLDKYRQGKAAIEDCSQVLVGKISHQLNVQYRLDFLEYIHSVLPKKLDISLENFKRLWDVLIMNPVHASDKNMLLDLLIKSANSNNKYNLIKDHNIEDLFRTVFASKDLFLKPGVMSAQLYKSIEKYFLFINQRNQSIVHNKGLYKVAKYDNIIGLDFFWTAVIYAKEEVVAMAGNTLVNVHLRTEKLSQVEQKLQMWGSFLHRCKETLRQNYEIESKTNMIRLLQLLIQQIEGKKYLSGNEPSKIMVKFTAQLHKDDKSLKQLQLPSNLTLLQLRKHLNQEFNLKEQDYELYFANYDVKLSPESEEDYGVQQIEEARDREKTDVIIQSISSSPHPLFNSVNKFKSSLANNTEISEILFDLLQNVPENKTDDIWEVLTLLPQNKMIKQQIEKLTSDQSEESWIKILNLNSPRKLLYCLQIIQTIIQEKKEKDKWMQDFVKLKGVYWLQKYYYNIPQHHFKVIFNLKLLSALATTLQFFYKNYYTQYSSYFDFMALGDKLTVNVAQRTLEYISIFFETAPLKQANDQTTTEFIQTLFDFIILILSPNNVNTLLPSIPQLLEVAYSNSQSNPVLINCLSKSILLLANQFQLFKPIVRSIIHNTNYLDLLSSLLLQSPQTLSDIDFIPITSQVLQQQITDQHFNFLHGVSLHSQQAFDLIEQSNLQIVDQLFHFPTNFNSSTQQSNLSNKQAGYALLSKLLSKSEGITQQMISTLSQYIQCSYWRTQSYQNWNINQLQMQKSRTGYVGLKNLGCTCYMNSLMQQLYTLPHFRDPVLQIPLEQQPNSVLYQFQLLLSALKSSQKQYYDPRPLCNVLGPDNSPINVLEQMDVDEFWSGFMDKLESELKPLKKDLLITRNFGGLLSNELICKDCPHQSSREELFLALPLQVKGKKDIQQSLQTVTEGEMLEGDNAYFCEKCEKKVRTLMRVCIKKLPNVLLLVLKRFEFNFETLSKFKLNDYCEFPMKLNMKQYTHEYLKTQEWKKRQEDEERQEEPVEIVEHPESYYEYQLRGVIIHIGTADSGHYTALIKDQNDQWFEFNDTIVKSFDISELGSEAFGNSEKQQSYSVGGISRERQRNAYMVFYERNVYYDDNQKPLENENELKWYFNKENNEQEKQNTEILQDNIKFQINKIMFDKVFFDFQMHLLNDNPDSYAIVSIVFQFFMVVVIRSQDRTKLPLMYKPLKQAIKSNLPLARDIVKAFAHIDIVSELLIHNQILDMKYIILSLLSLAITTLATQHDTLLSYKDFKATSQNATLIQAYLALIWHFRSQAKKCDQFFRIGQLLALSSSHALLYLLRHKAVGRILLYLLEEPPHGPGYQTLSSLREQPPILALNRAYINEPEITQPQANNIWEINSHNYTYLVTTLSELVTGMNDHQLDDDEIALLQDQQVISRLLAISYTRKARNALGKMFNRLITIKLNAFEYDPWAMSMRLVQAIYNFYKDCDEREVKSCLVGLQHIANVSDAYEDQRVSGGDAAGAERWAELLGVHGNHHGLHVQAVLEEQEVRDHAERDLQQEQERLQADRELDQGVAEPVQLLRAAEVEGLPEEGVAAADQRDPVQFEDLPAQGRTAVREPQADPQERADRAAGLRLRRGGAAVRQGPADRLHLPQPQCEQHVLRLRQLPDLADRREHRRDGRAQVPRKAETYTHFSNRWIFIDEDSIAPPFKGVARYKNFVSFLK